MRVEAIVPKHNKKAQVTIFIIVAIVLVAIVAVFFVLRGATKPEIERVAEENPEAFMQLCLEEDLMNNIRLIREQGGFVDPTDYHMYEDKKVAYLCKTLGYYEPCINQHPMILTEINREIEKAIEEDVESCLNEMETSFEEKGMEVELNGPTGVRAELAPRNIFLDVTKDVSITANEQTSQYKKFDLGMKSPLYELVHIAARIVNNEAKYCYFERQGYMNLHPEYEIFLHGMSDGTKIYSIKDINSQEQMNIAIKGCLL